MAEVGDALNRYETELEEVERTWKNYREIVKRLLNSWIIDKPKILSRLSELEGLLQKYQDELKELNIRYELGLMSEEELRKSIESIEKEMQKLNEHVEELRQRLTNIERLCLVHAFQARLPFTGASIREIKEKISRLEELKRQGRLLDEVYVKIKRELEDQLRILEEKVSEIQGQSASISTGEEEKTS